MKKNIVVAIIFALSLFTSQAAMAAKIFVSPRPGEGPVQIAERYGADPAVFIRLNRSLGNFVRPKRPSLVYTWQKFELPESKSLKKTELLKAKLSAGISVVIPSDSAARKFLTVTRKTENAKNKVSLKSVRLSDRVVFSGLALKQSASSAGFFFFGICIFYALILCLYFAILGYGKKVVSDKIVLSLVPKQADANKRRDQKFFVGYSSKFESYVILPNDGKNTEFQFDNTISKIIEIAAGLCMKYDENTHQLFSYELMDSTGNRLWRSLSAIEKKMFESGIKTLALIEKNKQEMTRESAG